MDFMHIYGNLFQKQRRSKTRTIVIIAGIFIAAVLAAQAGWLGLAVGLAVPIVLCLCSAAVFVWVLRAVPFLMIAISVVVKKIRERMGER